MKRNIFLLFIFLCFQINILWSVNDSTQTKKHFNVFTFKIDEEIAPPAERKTKKAMEQAKELNADIIILHLNTFGGMLDAADKIRTMILESEIPVWVFIDNNAASAGALISIACDSIYMCSGASIGAASVVNQNGEIMPDKYQSYMRSLMRSTAEANGRDPNIAEAMVDPRVYIEGVNDTGKVLTFTTQEAILNGYCEGSAQNIDEILKNNNIIDYTIIEQELSWIDYFIGFLVNPIVSGILIMLIIGGIYFEFQTPGVGFPLIVAITGAVLYFAPLYLEGLASNWEILLFIAGVGLLAAEIFVIPGFGVAGVSGIFLIIMSLTFSLVHNEGFDFQFTGISSILKAFFIVIISIISSFFLSIWLGQKILSSTRFGELSLFTTQKSSEGFVSVDISLKEYVGKKGIASTLLRPSGKITVDDELFDATAETGFIDKGENVIIVKFENQQMIVRKI